MTAERAEETIAAAAGYDAVELAYDVLDGLTRPFKDLSSRFLYDERGVELFGQILELPEYYQGRTELRLLHDHAVSITARWDPTEIVDLGSGSGEKAAVLIDAACAQGDPAYVPVDLSPEMLADCEGRIRDRFPALAIQPVACEFDALPETLGPAALEARRLIVMLGGTIGNLLPGTRRRFLRMLAGLTGSSGAVIAGVDLVKDPAVIEAAYDDDAGVTAAFNRNLLATLNAKLGADFDVDAFDHVIVFDRDNSWIEMRLRARRRMRVRFEAIQWEVEFMPGEEMRTEVSAKFSRGAFEQEVGWAGFAVSDWLTDTQEQYALAILTT